MKSNIIIQLKLMACLLLCAAKVFAYEAEIGGIYYNLDKYTKQASVTYQGEDYNKSRVYSGDVIIPSTVVYEGETYDVTSIGDFAFYRCTGLTSVTIPKSVVSIGENAFYFCERLTSVTIPSSVTSIGNNAFQNCTSLTSVIIPSSVTKIGSGAFQGCTGLTTIPSGLSSIVDYMFSFCWGFTSIDIPSSVTSIGNNAFQNCTSLTSVTIPSSVTNIDSRAFQSCYRLHTIYCLNPTPPTCGYEMFICNDYVRDKYDVYTYATLHVPMGSQEVYSSAYEWRYFNEIKEDMEVDGNVFYANLTVKQGTTGYTRQAIKADEKYTIYIGALGENKLNAITFNGADVTDQVVNGYYTTPEIKGESVLSISYEVESNVKSQALSQVKVTGYDGEIRVAGIDESADVNVYTADGKLGGSMQSAYGSANIRVSPDQLYLVRVGDRTYKVAL